MARAIRVKSISGALTVTVTGSAGGTPTVYTDDTFATTVTLPATVTSGATLNMCFRSPDTYALSVKANGVEIAGDNNTTRPVDLESSSTLAAYAYDARLTSPIAGSSGPEGLLANLNGSYIQSDAARQRTNLLTSLYPTRQLWAKAYNIKKAPPAQVRYARYGSSVADMKWRELASYLVQTFGGQVGAILDAGGANPDGNVVWSGITVSASTGTIVDNTTDFDWPSHLTATMANASTRTWGGGVMGTCDHIEIYYLTGPSGSDGGTFQPQVDGVDSGSPVSTVNASVGFGVVTLTPAKGSHTVGVRVTAGSVRVVGVGAWDSTSSGIIPISVSQGGINLYNTSAAGLANWTAFLAHVAPDMLTFEMKANQIDANFTAPPGTAFTAWLQAVKNAAIPIDVAVIGSTPDSSAEDELLVQPVMAAACIATSAGDFNPFFWDGYTALRDWATVNGYGASWAGDGIHLGSAAEQFLAARFARDLGLFVNMHMNWPYKINNTATFSQAFSGGAKPNTVAYTVKSDSGSNDEQHLVSRWWSLFNAAGSTEFVRLIATGSTISWLPQDVKFGAANAGLFGDASDKVSARQNSSASYADLQARTFLRLVNAISSSGGTLALDFSARGHQKVTLTGNVTTVTFTGQSNTGARVAITFLQDGTGSRTVTGWNASIKFAGGTAPTLSTVAGARDHIEFEYDGGTWVEVNRSLDIR